MMMGRYYSVLIISLLFLSGCGNGEEVTEVKKFRIIKNASSYHIKLIIDANEQYQIDLKSEDSVVFKGYVESGPGVAKSDVGWNDSKPISGRIIFDNTKELVYLNGNCESGRNPLNPYLWELSSCGYFNEDNDGDGASEWYYVINDADYEMAVPIED